eukprot:GEMP01050231.1.p1 GENE.GEMP01050231.1~~GEMP01050231.1.p1  ORF type:complete len:285 (+),score=61.24 GEMP01050231.1:106-960(+)
MPLRTSNDYIQHQYLAEMDRECDVYVPNAIMGWIVGENGKQIQEIREQSGVRILNPKREELMREDGFRLRSIEIKGHLTNIARAKELLAWKILDYFHKMAEDTLAKTTSTTVEMYYLPDESSGQSSDAYDQARLPARNSRPRRRSTRLRPDSDAYWRPVGAPGMRRPKQTRDVPTPCNAPSGNNDYRSYDDLFDNNDGDYSGNNERWVNRNISGDNEYRFNDNTNWHCGYWDSAGDSEPPGLPSVHISEADRMTTIIEEDASSPANASPAASSQISDDTPRWHV